MEDDRRVANGSLAALVTRAAMVSSASRNWMDIGSGRRNHSAVLNGILPSMTRLEVSMLEQITQNVDDYNRSLGAYMTAFSELETAVYLAFSRMAGLEPEASRIIFDKIGNREQIEIVSELALIDKRLTSDFTNLKKMLSECSSRRNKIVHGSWWLIDGVPARVWNGVSTKDRENISGPSDKAVSNRKRFAFTLEQIEAASGECKDLSNEVLKIVGEISHQIIAKAGERIFDRVARARGISADELRAQHAPKADPE